MIPDIGAHREDDLPHLEHEPPGVPGDVLEAFQKGNAQPLIDWVEAGADGQISWCAPGDFDDCVSVMSAHLDSPEGFCQLRHEAVCGGPAGSEDHSMKGEAMTMTRSELLSEWKSNPIYAAALTTSYEMRTAVAREMLGEDPYWAFISQAERDKAAASGAAMDDGSYPITSCDGPNSVSTAISAVGRGSGSHDAIRKHIITRAKSLGCSSLIPDNWGEDGSMKAAAEVEALADIGTPPAPAAAAPDTPDGDVDKALDEIDKAIADAEAAERKDMAADGDTGPSVVLKGLDSLKSSMLKLRAQQLADEKAEAGPTAAPAPEAPTPPPPKKEAPVTAAADGAVVPAPPADSMVDHDAKTSQAIDAAIAAVDQALKLQQADLDSDDPNDSKILAGLQGVQAQLADIAKTQTADNADSGEAPAVDLPVPAAHAVGDTPGNAIGVAGDADDSPPGPGDIEDAVPCENPECKHLASAHQDTADGKNTGACTMDHCVCPGIVIADSKGNPTVGQEDTQSAPAAPAPVVASGPDEADYDNPVGTDGLAAKVPVATPASGDHLPAPNPVPTLQGPEFCIPVGVIEGVATGDGRAIIEGALDWLDPPLLLMGLFTSTHDPNGMDPNDPADIIGRIDKIERRADDNGVIMATGHLLTTDEGQKAAQIIEQMGRVPVSADVGGRAGRQLEVTSALDDLLPEIMPEPGGDIVVLDTGGDDAVPEDADTPEPLPGVAETLTQGTVLGFTVVPHSAFEDCFIVLGDGSDQPPITELVNRAPISETAEPVAASMGYMLHVDVCEPCATGTPVVASGGPVAPPKAWFENPAFTRDDPRMRETVDDKSGRLTGKFACPPTVTEDGEVLMHIAQWNVCHTSPMYAGKCMLAPRNHSGYAYWHGGGQVLTAEGELVDVGPITVGTGHASLNASMAETLAHYDNTGTAVAYGCVGEDEFGIWFHGALAPDATEEQVYKLRASVPSGDWRPRGNRQELMAALMVNRGGFPHARAHSRNGRQVSLVAAGVPAFAVPEIEEAPVEVKPLSFAERFALIERAALPVAHDSLVERMAALRS
jgi:hypothetical protein